MGLVHGKESRHRRCRVVFPQRRASVVEAEVRAELGKRLRLVASQRARRKLNMHRFRHCELEQNLRAFKPHGVVPASSGAHVSGLVAPAGELGVGASRRARPFRRQISGRSAGGRQGQQRRGVSGGRGRGCGRPCRRRRCWRRGGGRCRHCSGNWRRCWSRERRRQRRRVGGGSGGGCWSWGNGWSGDWGKSGDRARSWSWCQRREERGNWGWIGSRN
mmetsp:Transcript_84658/g.169388  ORF Transcript_84658/g.169388 Transcript_84658/m.169388 type:complete len:218 (-) Transcript_84658:505-1158(-)